jgi:uncharacterized membrane protein
MTTLLLACLTFVGTHLLMSHPLRAGMVKALGTNGFMGVYSLVSLVSLAWLALAFRAAPLGDPLWLVGDGLWALASLIMLLAAILLMGSFIGNPALPAPNAKALAAQEPKGVFTITRHPMMWSFFLWAIAHSLVSPRPAVLVLCASMGALALFGALGQDAKKAKLMGEAWQTYMARTAFIPFAKGAKFPGMHALGGGLVVWLLATWAHPLLGGPIAGVWRWFQ